MRITTICFCPCHNHYRGTQKAASQMGKYMKSFTFAERANHWDQMGCAQGDDPVAAAVACPECINDHCGALLTFRPKRGPRIIRVSRKFDPNSDSQQTESDTQADGEKGNEDGG